MPPASATALVETSTGIRARTTTRLGALLRIPQRVSMGLMASRASCILKKSCEASCDTYDEAGCPADRCTWGSAVCHESCHTYIHSVDCPIDRCMWRGDDISHHACQTACHLVQRASEYPSATDVADSSSAHRCIWRDGSCLIRCSSSSTSGDCPIDRCSWEDDACKVLLGDVQRISDGTCADAGLAGIKDMEACEEAASRAEYPSGDFTSCETSADCQSMNCEERPRGRLASTSGLM